MTTRFSVGSSDAEVAHSPTERAAAQKALDDAQSQTVAGMYRMLEESLARLRAETDARVEAAKRYEAEIVERGRQQAAEAIAQGNAMREALHQAAQQTMADLKGMGNLTVELAGIAQEQIERGRKAAEVLAQPPPPKSSTADAVRAIGEACVDRLGRIIEIAMVKNPQIAEGIARTLNSVAEATGEPGADGSPSPTQAPASPPDEQLTLDHVRELIEKKLGGFEGAWWQQYAAERQISDLGQLSIADIRQIIAAAREAGA